MIKEKFITEKESIKNNIEILRNKLKEIEHNFIEHNKPFSIGDRVKRISNNEYGFVYDFEVDYWNEIRIKAYKEKKDGTPSKQTMYVYKSSDFELANK